MSQERLAIYPGNTEGIYKVIQKNTLLYCITRKIRETPTVLPTRRNWLGTQGLKFHTPPLTMLNQHSIQLQQVQLNNLTNNIFRLDTCTVSVSLDTAYVLRNSVIVVSSNTVITYKMLKTFQNQLQTLNPLGKAAISVPLFFS